MSMVPQHQRPSVSQQITKVAFWAFKAFAAMGTSSLTGGLDVLVGIGTQLIAEGISYLGRRSQGASGQGGGNNCNNITHVHNHTYITNNYNNSNDSSSNSNAQAITDRATYAQAIESMVRPHGSVENFQRGGGMTDFGEFSGELSRQLDIHGDEAGGEAMRTVASIYRQFQECDTDRSGDVSMEEFVEFCKGLGVSRESAMVKFFRADVNGDGQISFEEWTAMMMGRVGRAESGLNCGGRHGLTQYTALYSGISCNFCGEAITVGSLASGCRRCNCDACSSCAGLPQASPRAQPFQGSSSRTLSLSSVRDVNDLKCRCSHGLKPIAASAGMYCSWCLALVDIGNPAAGCRACQVYSCVDCVAISLEARCASALTCRDRHGLTKRVVKTPSYACDFCRDLLVTGDTIYGCRTCEMGACVMCMWKDHLRALSSTPATFSCPGNHQLRPMRIYGYQQQVHTCTWCLGTPSLKGTILRCHVCEVNVCDTCQASRFEETSGFAHARSFAQQAFPAPTCTAGLSPPPPSYAEHVSNSSGHGGAPSPLPRVPPACASGANPSLIGAGHARPGGGSYIPAKCAGGARASSTGFGHARSERVLHHTTRQKAFAPDFPDDIQPTLQKANSSPIPSEEWQPKPLQKASSPGFSEKWQSTRMQTAGSLAASEERQQVVVDAEFPFPFDSVVRVLSLEEDDPLGRLMTVIGFDPSGGVPGGEGEVVLNWRGKVERAPTFLVCRLDMIQ